MSKPRKKRVTNQKQAIDRPFDPAVLRRAAELARQYKIVLEPDPDEGFVGTAVELPLCLGTGRTPDKCVKDTRDVITSVVATMIEMGEVPPVPASQHARSEQINVRVSPEEKFVMEEAARRKGFRGISDFVRTTTLSQLRSA